MHRTGALTLTLVVTACAGGVTDPAASWLARRVRPAPPAGLANATATFNELQAISAVTNTPLFESFTVLAPQFTAAGAVRAAALTALSLELAARYSPWHPKVPPKSGHHGAVAGAPAGTTFVWDPATDAYVASSDAGAPANGERFMLYALSQRTGLPSLPLTSIGYVDLIDSSAGAVGVTLVGTSATGPPATYARYCVARGTASVTSLVGFVTDGTTRLDLRVRTDSTAPGTLSVQTAIAVAGRDVQLSEAVTVSPAGGDTARMTTDLRVTSGGETVRATADVTVDTTTRIGSGRMTVSVNDGAFATLTLGGPDLVVAAAPDVTLTTADETTLRALFSTSFELFGTVRVLFTPVPSRGPHPLSTNGLSFPLRSLDSAAAPSGDCGSFTQFSVPARNGTVTQGHWDAARFRTGHQWSDRCRSRRYFRRSSMRSSARTSRTSS